MDLLQTVYDSGDIRWLIPAMVGALIVLLGLIRLLFSETIGWALAFLIIFGGALSGVSVVSNLSFAKAQFAGPPTTTGIDVETVAAVGAAGEKLKQAISANTEAIEGMQSAVTEIRSFTEMLAVASNAALGDVALTSDEIAGYKSGVETLLTESGAAIVRSKDAELEAVRTLDVLNQQIQKKIQAKAE